MSSDPRPVVVAVDQGTSATKALVLGADGAVAARSSVGLTQQHPQPGWVEQDPNSIRDSVLEAIDASTESTGAEVLALGLSTQRESAVIWDRTTGQPLGPVLGWQDRRTADRARQLIEDGSAEAVRRSTGLPVDPMFSALKIQWLLDSVDPDRRLSRAGRIAAGTVDSWLLYCLTGEHRIEAGNASRTQLMNLDKVDWDPDMLDLFQIPEQVLPPIAASVEASGSIGATAAAGSRVRAVMGDSHSALYAHGVRGPGTVKATYGTGSSVMGLLGDGTDTSRMEGLVRTLAWHDGQARYAFEGNILATGATALWLAGILDADVAHLDSLARTVEDTGRVNIVPAFAGLGAPWWDEGAQALISGFDLGTSTAHLARAAFESIALQIEDVLAAAEQGIGTRIEAVLADGGPTSNGWLMQLQADLSQRRVLRSATPDLSALGVAHMAALQAGLCSAKQIESLERHSPQIVPALEPARAAARRDSWADAVARARWAPRPQHPQTAATDAAGDPEGQEKR